MCCSDQLNPPPEADLPARSAFESGLLPNCLPIMRHHFCEYCLCSGDWTGLDHSVVSYEKFGSWVYREAVEKRLQLGPESVAAERSNRAKLTHGALLCV